MVAVHELGVRMDDRFEGVEQRLDRLKQRMIGVETKVTAQGDVQGEHTAILHDLDGKVSGLDGKVSGLAGKVSALDGKVSGLAGKVSALDGKVSALDGKVSAQGELLEEIGVLVRRLADPPDPAPE
jgi:hypothetical protein